jgi:hypothetical protein
MSEDSGYFKIGSFFGGIVAFITFFAVWYAAAQSAGWVVGIALGWIPAGIAAAIAGGLTMLLWLPVLLLIGYLLLK